MAFFVRDLQIKPNYLLELAVCYLAVRLLRSFHFWAFCMEVFYLEAFSVKPYY